MSTPEPGQGLTRSPARSSIDPTTGITVLSPIELDRHLGSLLGGHLPDVALPSFLHESTHHWCFFSPVGLSLTLLNLRARRRAWRLHDDPEGADTDEAFDMYDDFVRYDGVTRALAPLAEGLAMFAEFDALPTTSRVASTPMTTLAAFSSPDAGEPIWERLAARLLLARTQPLFLDRKTSLLTGAMTEEAGYLPGYLAVKRIWLQAWGRNDRLGDPDLFLHLLTFYIYNDMDLVSILLGTETSDYGTVGVVQEHLQRRLAGFEWEITDDWLDDLERAADLPFLDEDTTGTLEDVLAQLPLLGSEPEVVERGRKRLRETLGELNAEADADGEAGQFARAMLWSVSQRQLLTLGRLPVELDPTDDGWGRVWHGGNHVASGRLVGKPLGPARRRASMEVFVNPWRWGRYMAFTVSVDGEPVLVQFSRTLAPAVEKQFDGYVTDTTWAQQASDQLARILERELAAEGTATIVLPSLRASLAEWTARVYAMVAWRHLEDRPALDAMIARTSERGLLAILGRISLVRALAWISLNWRLHDLEGLGAAFEEARPLHGVETDLATTIVTINDAALRELGTTFVVSAGRRVYTVV